MCGEEVTFRVNFTGIEQECILLVEKQMVHLFRKAALAKKLRSGKCCNLKTV